MTRGVLPNDPRGITSEPMGYMLVSPKICIFMCCLVSPERLLINKMLHFALNDRICECNWKIEVCQNSGTFNRNSKRGIVHLSPTHLDVRVFCAQMSVLVNF
jgi:hypothetical protein